MQNTIVHIIPFESHLSVHFKHLNVQWLQRYFEVEPKDELLLDHCEENIIAQGGYIFFAQWDAKIVGCFSFLKIDQFVFELGKMAVDPNYQGLKIGQSLLQFAIAFAKAKGWKKIILYSNTKLVNALYIYTKFGFTEVALEKDIPYLRSNIKMEYNLMDTHTWTRK
ncbi:GNAT family N-acetyltransferase [Arenibacter sp. GZD96]|uniref:GNAT family N-acetyltransferase n=1 Tax=Aurantibrevibacter litoralis TaxID=3106030 RepID=UPI002AFDD842|nr:GNAT family N-acetyltransferase [Arenibacter sp. GZD-96]MEA1786282.1 GNAT family N-acetyltransferase [Arenibacter sp. GZD-96]